MTGNWDASDRVVDPHFSKLVNDVQVVVTGVVQRVQQLKLEENDAAEQYERQLQQIQLPEVESLCQEIRNSGDKLVSHINEALKQLMTAITTSVSNEMRRVMRNVTDDCVKTLTENRQKSGCGDNDMQFDFLIRQQIDQINHRLRHISRRVFSLNQQNHLLSQLEQQLGLDSGEEDRSRKVQQLLHSALWSDEPPDEPDTSDPGPFPQLCQSGERAESPSDVLSSPTDGQRVRCEAAHSGTKDKTFAEILTDGDNGSKKWETKRSSERKSCCRKVPE